jgi:GxxExxY protein
MRRIEEWAGVGLDSTMRFDASNPGCPLDERAATAVVDAAIDVHRTLGPGLLESVYESCLEYELLSRGFAVRRQTPMSVAYRGFRLEGGFRLDLVVDSCLVVEIKAVEMLNELHRAQLITYLRLGRFRLGLLLNFNVSRMTNGIRRVINSGAPCESQSAGPAMIKIEDNSER